MALAGGALPGVVGRLSAAGCVAPGEEATELLARAPDAATLDAWIGRREHGEPLAWIVGSTLFCGRRIDVAPGVYVPRHYSEQLARRAARLLPPGGVAVDVCSGSGAVATHLRATVPSATVVSVDIDAVAARCARGNGVPAVVADLDAPLRGRCADVVTAVPPYVPTGALRLLPTDVQRYEPRRALDGGPDGLDLVRRVVAAAGRLLRPGGSLLVEVGGDQYDRLADDLTAAGLGEVTCWADEEGDLRGIAARLAPE